MEKIIPKTELLYQKSKPIDQLNLMNGIHLMVNEQKKAALEVKKSAKSIEEAIIKITHHLSLNPKSRMIYVGAGTSGRIGMQDSVELYPTFNWPQNRVGFILAGGRPAIFKAIENAEDNTILAALQVKRNLINCHDVVIGIAASGNTPFTCKILESANKKKALTIAISNNPFGEILNFGKVKIVLNTKEEVIAGSTRLKAGTAQKICLNIISSLVMVKLGFIKNGEMTNLVPTNDKLRQREARIKKTEL